MKPDTKNLLIGEKNGKYFTQLSETEFNTLVSILQMNLGGLHYERSNELNKDTVDNIYKELVNITDYNPNSPYGAVITPSNTPRRKFIESLDKEEVITFLLKYGRLNREIEVTRQIVAEQKIWIELPESIDATAYKKEGFGRDGYDTPAEAYIHEELLEDDDYSYHDQEGELGWSQIDDQYIGDYKEVMRFAVVLNLPSIDFYGFDVDDWKEVA